MTETDLPPNDQLPPAPENQSPPNHWHLVRDVVALQFKLALDGVLDLLMSPVSIFAAIAGFGAILRPREPRCADGETGQAHR